ncbi:hypothetical protein GE061_016326 [Apolygus lucorum]|uniref:Major facilitator superfamily (MFS) profile domain-containing protein n=1 Tax=Apolygus lucorum TaxID=248454 RepID=A0A6A4K457_APOLU|nr:hypothetical protein GE061_016326 [Apolygus lucorum]
MRASDAKINGEEQNGQSGGRPIWDSRHIEPVDRNAREQLCAAELRYDAGIHSYDSQASWIASLASIAIPFGCLASGPLIDRFGRRVGLFALNVPAFVGWLCMAFRPTLLQLYIGRLLTGFATGLSSTPATVYVAEVSTSAMRGLFVTGSSISISAGVAIVYTLGLIFGKNWPMVAAVCSAFPIISTLLIWCQMPESPVWLISKNKGEAAGSALKRLRGVDQVSKVQEELDQMADQSRAKKNSKDTLMGTIKALSRPEAYKPLLLMNIFFLFQQLTGIFVVIFYAVDVVREAGVTTNPFVVAVLIGLTRLLFTILAAYMSKKLGRRPAALISGVGMTVSLLVLATHLINAPKPMIPAQEEFEVDYDYNDTFTDNSTDNNTMFQTTGEETIETSLIPVISILLYILTSTLGFLTLPWAMIGEVFPSQVRGVAGGITTCMTYTISFFAVKLYPAMVSSLDKHGVFYFYGTMALLGTIFVFFFLPETQGKTLAQIEEHFAGKKRRRQTTQEEEEMLNGTKMVTIQPKGRISPVY